MVSLKEVLAIETRTCYILVPFCISNTSPRCLRRQPWNPTLNLPLLQKCKLVTLLYPSVSPTPPSLMYETVTPVSRGSGLLLTGSLYRRPRLSQGYLRSKRGGLVLRTQLRISGLREGVCVVYWCSAFVKATAEHTCFLIRPPDAASTITLLHYYSRGPPVRRWLCESNMNAL